jgi:hypothetical protein
VSRLPLALALAAAACATSKPLEKDPFPGTAPPPAAPGAAQPAGVAVPPAAAAMLADVATLDPVAYAAKLPKGAPCEAAARALLPTSADKAWGTLRACVARGGFTALSRIVDGAWDEELRTRSDAAVVVAQVVAARGGDVTGDLNSLRARRIPIFALGPSISHPDLYKGRLLLVRARVDDIRAEKGRTTVQLAEFALGGRAHWVEGNTRSVRNSSSRGNASVEVSSSKYGAAKAKGAYESGSTTTWGKETKRFDNVAEETGNVALARLAAPDPFLEPGRQFVVLGRFDGVRSLANEDEEGNAVVGVLSVIAYFEPSAHVVE